MLPHYKASARIFLAVSHLPWLTDTLRGKLGAWRSPTSWSHTKGSPQDTLTLRGIRCRIIFNQGSWGLSIIPEAIASLWENFWEGDRVYLCMRKYYLLSLKIVSSLNGDILGRSETSKSKCRVPSIQQTTQKVLSRSVVSDDLWPYGL